MIPMKETEVPVIKYPWAEFINRSETKCLNPPDCSGNNFLFLTKINHYNHHYEQIYFEFYCLVFY